MSRTDRFTASTALPQVIPFRAPAADGLPFLFTVEAERPGDAPAREGLLDRAMGPGRRRKSSEALRRGRLPAEGLAFVARTLAGTVVGTVRLWHVDAGSRPALLLGPLACAPEGQGRGVGSALMERAIAEARRLGHGAILLVGDAAYYERFGFGDAPVELAMPGPFARERFRSLELVDGALEGAGGVLKPTGRRRHASPLSIAA